MELQVYNKSSNIQTEEIIFVFVSTWTVNDFSSNHI